MFSEQEQFEDFSIDCDLQRTIVEVAIKDISDCDDQNFLEFGLYGFYKKEQDWMIFKTCNYKICEIRCYSDTFKRFLSKKSKYDYFELCRTTHISCGDVFTFGQIKVKNFSFCNMSEFLNLMERLFKFAMNDIKIEIVLGKKISYKIR